MSKDIRHIDTFGCPIGNLATILISRIAATGELFRNYEFSKIEEDEIIDFLFVNFAKLREVSLRTALKIADLRKSFPGKWQEVAKVTVMKN